MKTNDLPSLPFGKTFRVGNFSVVKIKRTLSKKQIAELRKESKLPKELVSHVERSGMAVIKVSAISGIWGIEFAEPSTMFMFLDSRDMENETDNLGLHNLFVSWLTDTSVIGDKEYWARKGELMQEFVARQRRPVDDEADASALEEIKTMMDAKQGILEAAEELKKEL